MHLIDIEKITSFASLCRGIDYYRNGYVYDIVKIDNDIYTAKVKGSKNNFYEVTLNAKKLRSSTCNCPFCNGHPLRMCKHKVATYFAIFPNQYEYLVYRDAEYQKEREVKIDEYFDKISHVKEKATKEAKKKIEKLSPEMIKKRLLKYMINDEMDIIEERLKEEYAEYINEESW